MRSVRAFCRWEDDGYGSADRESRGLLPINFPWNSFYLGGNVKKEIGLLREYLYVRCFPIDFSYWVYTSDNLIWKIIHFLFYIYIVNWAIWILNFVFQAIDSKNWIEFSSRVLKLVFTFFQRVTLQPLNIRKKNF